MSTKVPLPCHNCCLFQDRSQIPKTILSLSISTHRASTNWNRTQMKCELYRCNHAIQSLWRSTCQSTECIYSVNISRPGITKSMVFWGNRSTTESVTSSTAGRHVCLALFQRCIWIDRTLFKSLCNQLKRKKTYQFTSQCKSDKVTLPKQHKSFFWDDVIERSHCTYNPLDVTPFNFSTASLSRE